MAALSAHQRRPLTLIAESDLNDPLLVTPREAGGYGLRRPVERRLPPRAARRADRRDQRLLRRLRAARGAGEGLRARLLPRRHVLVVPRPRARRPDRHRARCRPGGSWCAARTTTRSATGPRVTGSRRPSTTTSSPAPRCSRWPGRSRRCCSRARSGRRRRRSSSSPRTPSPSSGKVTAEGRIKEFERMGWDPAVVPGPAGPGDVRALQAGLVGARGLPALADARDLPAAGRAAPYDPDLTDPSFLSVSCTADEDTRVFRLRRGSVEIVVNFGDEPQDVEVCRRAALHHQRRAHGRSRQLGLPAPRRRAAARLRACP